MMCVPVQWIFPFRTDRAFTNGSSRLRSIGSSLDEPRKTSLHPVAEPTRITQPASCNFGNVRRANSRVFSAFAFRLSRSGDDDDEKRRTAASPDMTGALVPLTE